MSTNSNGSVNIDNPNTIKVLMKEVLKSQILTEANISSRIFFVFIFIGIMMKIVFGNMDIYDPIDGNYGPASLTIWSYGTVMFSIICLIFLNIVISDKDEKITKVISIDMSVLIIYILWIISINMRHFKKINKKKIPDNYNLYSNLSLFVILFQTLFFLVNFLIKSEDTSSDFIDSNKDLFKKIDFINHLLMILNFILILNQQSILDNFSVDIF